MQNMLSYNSTALSRHPQSYLSTVKWWQRPCY